MQIRMLVQEKSFIPSVGPNLQKGALLLIRFKDHKKLGSFLSKMLKDLQWATVLTRGGALTFKRTER